MSGSSSPPFGRPPGSCPSGPPRRGTAGTGAPSRTRRPNPPTAFDAGRGACAATGYARNPCSRERATFRRKVAPLVLMSHLLDAIAGVPNACEPLPVIVTGGQPSAEHLAALQRAGCDVVLDLRESMEPRPYRTPDAVRAAGLEYVNIPFGHGAISDATFEAADAINEAMRIGTRNAGLLEQALEYVRRKRQAT